jgi:hypothetical protein
LLKEEEQMSKKSETFKEVPLVPVIEESKLTTEPSLA